jgi:hypothetical protein
MQGRVEFTHQREDPPTVRQGRQRAAHDVAATHDQQASRQPSFFNETSHFARFHWMIIA